MRCMVKLNDMEELVELLLGGAPVALTLAPLLEEAMDLDDEVGRRAGANNTTQFNLDDENFGLV